MRAVLLRIAISLAVSAGIYLVVAIGLVISDRHREPPRDNTGLAFDELKSGTVPQPDRSTYTARDGTELDYRFYPAEAERVLILLHGSGWHSRYLASVAGFLSLENLAQVYTPDLRGHGEDPDRRGDTDYVDQLVDDLADLVALVRERHPQATVIIGGHSSGGGLALRFAESEYLGQADAFLLLAPWLQYNAPTVRAEGAGWATPYTRRIIGLTMLNRIGMDGLNHLPVINFDLPRAYRDGTETLTYSYRLNKGLAPDDYTRALSAIQQPTLVLVGSEDALFLPDQFRPVFDRHMDARVGTVEGVSHLGIAVKPAVQPPIRDWLNTLPDSH
ncbi:lysophospholipase [Marinobacter bryozoorum]|jgi:alpha-beta hydrolase superfamily lysophospholipase|uniref:alpha/beta hydrolase n=1 Tax=Marinobacter bryozoorum TaxID=256324 RepID=UPI0020037082|nr:alpha/beta fold hydrolase [Marinobacter bryozoorum]MCK7545663.1 lysophospholipase [Marinobacter bryozoorum]